MKTLLRLGFAMIAVPAFAQVQPVAADSFQYANGAPLDNQFGGTGFATPWTVAPNGDEHLVFDGMATPPFLSRDGVGNYAGQAFEGGGAYRALNALAHPDVAEFGEFGRDGATLWISFSTVAYQTPGDGYGGLSLFDSAEERLFIGSPWASYAWGIDDKNGGVAIVPGSATSSDARIVVRIDHMAGNERLRLWLDPAVPHPTGGADIDTMIPDLRWTRIRLESGGSNTLCYWDDIVVEKGGTAPGIPFCDGRPNSTGAVGTMQLQGSAVVAANNLRLVANGLPPGQFGIFTTSVTVVAPTPVAAGNLCLGGAIGRYQAQGQILQADATGSFSLAIDLTAMPTSTSFVAAQAGETWAFQAWHRDFTTVPPIATTSNFTEGVQILFQ